VPAIRFLALCLALLTAPYQASGQAATVAFGSAKADPTLPVEVTADSLDVSQSDGSAEFIGNVRVDQGEMRLSAERVQVIYNQDQSAISRLVATGNVVLVNGPDAVEANQADYTIDTGTVVLSGSVLLTQGPGVVASERMVVNLTEGTAQLSGRVKTVLNPEKKP